MRTGGGTLYPPTSSGLVRPLYPPSQRCGLRQNFKQTTLTTRLYKVRTNLYPPTHLRKRSDEPVELSGVTMGWTGVDISTPLLLEVAPEIDTNPTNFYEGGRSASRPPL